MGKKVCLQTYENQAMAEMDLQFLKSQGIAAEINKYSESGVGTQLAPAFTVQIEVDEADLEDAQEAIGLDEDSDDERSFDEEEFEDEE